MVHQHSQTWIQANSNSIFLLFGVTKDYIHSLFRLIKRLPIIYRFLTINYKNHLVPPLLFNYAFRVCYLRIIYSAPGAKGWGVFTSLYELPKMLEIVLLSYMNVRRCYNMCKCIDMFVSVPVFY